jgi:membrane protease YdiL (CAAX protease family)
VTFTIMRFTFWRTHATGVPRLLGPAVGRAIGVGIGGAALASLAAAAYLLLLRQLGRLPAAEPDALLAVRSWLVPLAIVAAPIFEEFIFRGLIFGGLRRTYGGWRSALASAAIFAIVHPPLSVAPVFVMGLIAALVYDRAGMLLAPMVVHAGYNAAVTWLQPLLTR